MGEASISAKLLFAVHFQQQVLFGNETPDRVLAVLSNRKDFLCNLPPLSYYREADIVQKTPGDITAWKTGIVQTVGPQSNLAGVLERMASLVHAGDDPRNPLCDRLIEMRVTQKEVLFEALAVLLASPTVNSPEFRGVMSDFGDFKVNMSRLDLLLNLVLRVSISPRRSLSAKLLAGLGIIFRLLGMHEPAVVNHGVTGIEVLAVLRAVVNADGETGAKFARLFLLKN